MLISSATPETLITWFHSAAQVSQKLLCVLLAPAERDQRSLAALIENVYEADSILNNDVAFLLLHPGVDTPLGLFKGMGEFATLRGLAFPTRSPHGDLLYPLREAAPFRDMSDEAGKARSEIASQSARAMARFVPEFVNLLNIAPLELPALCVLVRGVDDAVALSLDANWTKDDLSLLLKRIRNVIDGAPNFQHEYRLLAAIAPADVKRADNEVLEREAKWRRVCAALEMVARRHGATETDVELITEFIASGTGQTSDLDALIASLSFAASPRFVTDAQIQMARRLMVRVEEIRESLSSDAMARQYVVSISERAEELVKQRDHIFAELRSVKGASIWRSSNQNAAPLSKIRRTLESINLAGDLGEKLFVAIKWAQLLVGT